MSCQQTVYPTDYYLSKPVSKYEMNLYMQSLRADYIPFFLPKERCLFYAPFAINDVCRVCQKSPQDHQKYFIYSIYVSKIQRLYFKYRFKKIIKDNYSLIFNNKSNLPFPALIIKYKIRYYRRWSRFTLKQFCNNYI